MENMQAQKTTMQRERKNQLRKYKIKKHLDMDSARKVDRSGEMAAEKILYRKIEFPLLILAVQCAVFRK